MREVFIGRQPICTPDSNVFAYELLYRGGDEHQAQVVDGDQATAEVILNTIELGMDEIIGNRPAFINIPRGFLLDDHCRLLPKKRVVLEILEDIEPDGPVIEAIGALSNAGYTIALDDFVYAPRLLPLVNLANIVKIDLLQVDKKDLAEHVTILRQHNVELLAEKVETYEDFDLCKRLGFDYFQGYFFCHPKLISSKQITANRLNVLQLVAKLQEPGVQPRDLETIIRTDVSLTYKILQYVNSASIARMRRIESVREAAICVGIDRIRTWATLLLFAQLNDKPRELVATAAFRAKMCEQLAACMSHQETETFFTVGLLSVLDAFMDRDMSDVLEPLPLSPKVKDALLHQGGILGEVLQCVINYEQCDWDRVKCSDLADGAIRLSYVEALTWASEAVPAMSASECSERQAVLN